MAAHPLELNSRGPEVHQLHLNLERIGFTLPRHEVTEEVFGPGTRDAVLMLQAQHRLFGSGSVDALTEAALAIAVGNAATQSHDVSGRIYLDTGVVAAGVTLRLYDHGFGGKAILLKEGQTDDQGYYFIAYDGGALRRAANIEIRTFDGRDEISLSRTKFGADSHEVINLVAPATIKPRGAEFRRLMADLEPHLGGRALADAREIPEQQDITLLHRATGWDARVIALAALAHKNVTETGLSAEAMYGLLRSGLPSDPSKLAQVTFEDVATVLHKARDANIIGLSDEQLTAAREAFAHFARPVRRQSRTSGALSSFGEMLDRLVQVLPQDLRLTDRERAAFEDIHFAHRGPGAELWPKVAAAGIRREKIEQLRLQTKLAHLTLCNAELIAALQSEVGAIENIGHLADIDLHRADVWKKRLEDVAGGNMANTEKLIPPAYRGESVDQRLLLYAEDLARKIRISFPTRVVARMVETSELRLGDSATHAQIGAHVCAFLRNGDKLGFRLGQVSLNKFIVDHRGALFAGIPEADAEATSRAVKRLQRLYQITPSNEALIKLYELDFQSARDVVRIPRDQFLRFYADRFPSHQQADLIYRKAHYVHTTTLTIVTTAKQLQAAIVPYVMASPEKNKEQEKKALIEIYPALEHLL